MPFRAFVRSAALVFLSIFALLASGCADASQTISADGAGESSPQVEDQTGDASVSVDQASSATPTVVDAAEPATSTPTTTVVATTTTTSTTTTTIPLPTAEECAAEVPLRFRVGQLMFPLVTQNDFAAAADLAERGLIGGVVVIGNPNANIASDIGTLQNRSLLGPVIVAVDEEGGTVQRLADITSAVPSAKSVAETQSLEQARETARAHAEAIGGMGFTMNLAPVVDLANGDFIGTRAFSGDAAVATDYGFATADGILDAGLTPVIKHFPGHGRGTDSHFGLPTLPELDVLRGSDLVPFVEAANRGDLPIMIGHLVVPGLTNGQPATLSEAAVNGLLREELGFDGLVMTDAFNMQAISDTTSNADAAELSLAAGVDLVMLGGLDAVDGTVDQVVAAVEAGTLDEQTITESFLRVLDTRDLRICAFPEDLRPKIGCDDPAVGCTGGQ